METSSNLATRSIFKANFVFFAFKMTQLVQNSCILLEIITQKGGRSIFLNYSVSTFTLAHVSRSRESRGT